MGLVKAIVLLLTVGLVYTAVLIVVSGGITIIKSL